MKEKNKTEEKEQEKQQLCPRSPQANGCCKKQMETAADETSGRISGGDSGSGNENVRAK